MVLWTNGPIKTDHILRKLQSHFVCQEWSKKWFNKKTNAMQEPVNHWLVTVRNACRKTAPRRRELGRPDIWGDQTRHRGSQRPPRTCVTIQQLWVSDYQVISYTVHLTPLPVLLSSQLFASLSKSKDLGNTNQNPILGSLSWKLTS